MQTLIATNVARIEQIRVAIDVRKSVVLMTPAIKRIMRRDFHLVTAKAFVFGKEPRRRQAIETALTDLCFQVECLVQDAAQYEQIEGQMPDAFSLEVRIVSAQAHRLLMALRRVDQCNARLYLAEFSGAMTRQERERMILPVMMAWFEFKRVVLGVEKKSISQLAQELKIA
jgi:hypothetical protein